MNDTGKITGTIRTFAAMAAGWIVAFIARLGLEVDSDLEVTLATALAVLFGTLYYIIVRLIAKKFPWAEWLLIIPKAPVYVPPDMVDQAQNVLDQKQRITDKMP